MPKYFSSDNVLEEFYKTLASGDERKLMRVHIPRSEVFYVREKVEADLGVRYSLDRIERAMYLEGFLEKADVFDPDTKRDWE